MKKISKIFCAISAAAVMLMSGAAVSAESEYKLYDEAGLLAEEDARDIETRLEEIAYTYSQDVIVYTTDDLEGNEVESYNKRLASELDAGINGSGIIYLVAMNDRKYDIYAFGQMKDEIMIKSIRDDLASDLQPYLTDGEYYTAFMGYADKVEEETYNVYENGPNTEPSYAVPIGIGCGLVIALVTVLVMKSQMNTLKTNPMANEYLRKDGFSLDRARDIFLYTSITRTKRETDSGSSGSSDSGHSSGSF